MPCATATQLGPIVGRAETGKLAMAAVFEAFHSAKRLANVAGSLPRSSFRDDFVWLSCNRPNMRAMLDKSLSRLA